MKKMPILDMKKQSQNKANSNPIQTQTKPILGQYQGCQSQNKAKQTQFQNPGPVLFFEFEWQYLQCK